MKHWIIIWYHVSQMLRQLLDFNFLTVVLRDFKRVFCYFISHFDLILVTMEQ